MRRQKHIANITLIGDCNQSGPRPGHVGRRNRRGSHWANDSFHHPSSRIASLTMTEAIGEPAAPSSTTRVSGGLLRALLQPIVVIVRPMAVAPQLLKTGSNTQWRKTAHGPTGRMRIMQSPGQR